MASIDNPQSEFPAGEDLVAYLDGELPPDDCRRVEERLAVDPMLRQQLRDLDQAWDALDTLPQPTAGDEFARTTIEMVALASQDDVAKHTATATAIERKRRLLWAFFGGVTLVAGFAGARMLLPDSNRALLADLPVIEQFDLLTQIGDIDFLRKLSNEVPLEKLIDDAPALERELQQIAAVNKPTREERRQWLETLSPADKAGLKTQFERYEKLPADAKKHQELKDLEKEISSLPEPEAEKLRRTMIAYGQWLSHWPSEQDKLLRAKTADERVSLVQSLLRKEDRRAASQLSSEDSKKLHDEILLIAKEHEREFLDELRKRDIQIPQNRFKQHPAAVALLIVTRELWKPESGEATRQRLKNQLSLEAQKQLEGSGRQWRERGFWQLRQWMVSSLEPKRDPGAVENFFATSTQLTEEDRAELFAKSAADMEADLERRYFGDQLGVGDKELRRVFEDLGRGPQGPPGPGGPGRRRPFDPPGGPGGPPPRDGGDPNGFERGRPDRGPGGPRRGPGGPDGPPPDDRRPPRPGDGPPPPPQDDREPV